MEVFGKIVKFFKLVWWYIADGENFLLHIIEDKALECIHDCREIGVSNIEELEDLLFHIASYYEIPRVVKEIKYSGQKFRNMTQEEKLDYFMEVETQRAVERDFIFEHAKSLSIGFEL